MQYALHVLMISIAVYLVTQMSLCYTNSEFKGVSPTTVSAYDFSKAQESQQDLEPYSFLSMKTVFLEMGVFFLINAMLLYTSIYFLVSIMNDLGQQNAIMYVEGSSSMETEKQRLKILMIFFGTSYLLRALIDATIATYYVEFLEFSSDYSGFFELGQSLYFVLTDVVPILSFFRMHD